jgi:tyrosine-specific transport protein
MNKKLFIAIATLSGTVIGAGILGIPHVVSKSGFGIGLIHLIGLFLITLAIKLMFTEVVLSSKTIHQIPGYASKYLGKKTKHFVFLATALGFYAAFVAYLIGEGNSLSFLFTGSLDYTLWFGLGFFAIMALLSFRGIKVFKKIEPVVVGLVLVVIVLLGIINFNNIDLNNLTYNAPSNLFVPFGVVLFSFLGVSAIPEMRRILEDNKKLLKKAVIIGMTIPVVVYILFTIIVLGLYGASVAQVATISFGKLVTLLGVFTMFAAYFALTLALQDTFRFDYKMHQKLAWFLTLIIPLILFVLIQVFDLAGFTKVLSLGGAIAGGILGIIILLIHEHLHDYKGKVHRKPEFKINMPLLFKMLIIGLFIVGIIYEFL